MTHLDPEVSCDALEAAATVDELRAVLRQSEAARRQLAAQQRRFRSLIENSTDLMTLMSPEGVVLYESPAISKMLGYDPDELVGQNALELIHPDDLSSVLETLAVLQQPGFAEPAVSPPYRFRHRDGSWRWLESSGSNLLHDPDVAALVVNSRDVTERVLVTEALGRSEARYRQIVETTQEGICVVGSDARLTFVSRRLAEMLGRSEAELLGHSAFEFVDPADHGLVRTELEKRREGVASEYDIRLLRKDGTLLWVLVASSPIYTPDGTFSGVLSLLTDITERRRTEETLRGREEQLRLAMQASRQAVWSWDPASGRVTIEGIDTAFQYAPEQVEQTLAWWSERIHPEDVDRVVAALDEYGESGEGLWQTTYRFLRGDGEYTDVLDTGVMARDAEGRSLGVLGVMMDISEHRRLEEQLRQAQKMEAVGRLAGGIAHDFNNMLAVINGYAELLLMGSPTPAALRNGLEEILRAGERSADLTRQLLAFSRRSLVTLRQVDLNERLTELAPLVRQLVGEHVEITTELDPALPRIKADPAQVEQVLLSLVANARDAMPEGGSLRLETANVFIPFARHGAEGELPGGHWVRLQVRDTGCGMDDEVRRHAFEPFFTTKPKGTGTGLGLSTVYGIVKQHGGHVTLESAPGRGALFSLYFPPVPGEAVPEREERTETGRAVLVAEDEPMVCELVCRVLEAAGHRVRTAASGAEALRIAETEGPFHLLLTDVVMPGMGGRELAERLLQRWPELKVLFMTGYTEDTVLRAGAAQSEADVILKPFSPAALEQRVRELLHAGRPRSGADCAPPQDGSASAAGMAQ